MAKRSSDPRVAYPEVKVQVRDLVRGVGIVAPFAPRGFSIRGNFVLSIGQAKSSIPALSYFQVGGMKHDQELYAKVSYIPFAELYAKGALCGHVGAHRAPIGALYEGSSVEPHRAPFA